MARVFSAHRDLPSQSIGAAGRIPIPLAQSALRPINHVSISTTFLALPNYNKLLKAVGPTLQKLLRRVIRLLESKAWHIMKDKLIGRWTHFFRSPKADQCMLMLNEFWCFEQPTSPPPHMGLHPRSQGRGENMGWGTIRCSRGGGPLCGYRLQDKPEPICPPFSPTGRFQEFVANQGW